MTDPLFRTDPYLRTAPARVLALTPEGGLILDRSIFYPAGGGQPGDAGRIAWDGGAAEVADTRKAEGGGVALILAEGASVPPMGAALRTELAWARRYLHMRVHTALHLLSVVLPHPVTGGAIGAGKGRLDFDLPESPAREAVEAELNALIARDLAVSDDWITDADLAANPGLVKTMSVKPPVGQGRVRLVRIGEGAAQVDLQPCGGTHVARTAEIGPVALGKIEKKGKLNRRVSITLT